MEIITKSAQETQKVGRRISADLKGGEILALTGDLGSGKTTFIQGLAKGLGIRQRIISPTFILMRKYDHFYHVDLYRLENNLKTEIEALGLTEFWQSSKNIIVIEWAEKIKDLLPKKTIWIKFKNLGKNKRRITIIGL